MDFGEAVATCFRKYFTFRGRAQRSEYWYFYLFTIIGSIVLGVIDAIAFDVNPNEDFAPFSDAFSLATMIPLLSSACRRLHDIGRSGWWQILPLAGLILMIPAIFPALNGDLEGGLFWGSIGLGIIAFLGLAILLIVWLATDSEKGPNRFGESPKYGSLADTFE